MSRNALKYPGFKIVICIIIKGLHQKGCLIFSVFQVDEKEI